MQSVFENIKERLEERKNKLVDYANQSNFDGWQQEEKEYLVKADECEKLIKIVNQVEQEYQSTMGQVNDGWIPCSKEMPKEKGLYLVSYGENTQVIVENYNGILFDEHYYFEQPKAWMHRPKPYDEEGE